MGPTSVPIVLQLEAGPESDDADTAESTRQLRQEIIELDVDRVDLFPTGPAPAGAKGDPVAVGSLLVTLAASGGVITTLINAVQAWLARRGKGTVTLELGGDKLSVTGVSSEQQSRLIDAWLSRRRVVLADE